MYTLLFNIVARDLPGGKQILIMNMRAQHITFNRAIKALPVSFNLRHLQTNNIELDETMDINKLVIYMV